MSSIFEKGKEKGNNKLILDLLLREDRLNKNKIARRIGKSYGIVHPRVDVLKEQGLLEEKENALWGLSALGLWVQAHRHRPLALNKCSDIISSHWKTFSDLYQLDKVETELPYHQFLTDWLSNEGLLDFLDTFSEAPLRSESEALVTFRRMLDLAMLSMETGYALRIFTTNIEFTGTAIDPTEALGEIVMAHKLLSKLHGTIREVDAPLYAYINSKSNVKLRSILPAILADELATIPFFKHQSAKETSETLRYISNSSLQKTIDDAKKSIRKRKKGYLHIPIYKIVVEGDKVTVVTEDPDSISADWKNNCNLCVLKKERNKIIEQMEPAGRVKN